MPPDLAKVLPLLESIEPHNAPNDDGCNRVDNEGPIESLEAHIAGLGEDRSDRDDKGYAEHDTNAEAAIEVGVGNDKISEEVGGAPDDRQGDAKGSSEQESKVNTRPNTGKSFRRHLWDWLLWQEVKVRAGGWQTNVSSELEIEYCQHGWWLSLTTRQAGEATAKTDSG